MPAYFRLVIACLALFLHHTHAARYVAKKDLKNLLNEQKKAIVEEVNDKMIYLVGAFSPSCPISTPLTKADLVDAITDLLIPEMKTQHSSIKEEVLDRVLKMHQDTLALLKTKLAEELKDLKAEIEQVAKKITTITQPHTTQVSTITQPHTTQVSTTTQPPTAAPAQQDCKAVNQRGALKDGVYKLAAGNQEIQVFCAGGYVTFQRRYNGQLKFDKTFSEYEQGFGSASSEHWLGLRYLHFMTKDKKCTFRARLAVDNTQYNKGRYGCGTQYTADCDGQVKEIVARDFRVSSAADVYRISVVLNNTDFLHPQVQNNFPRFNGQRFTTKDQDNDQVSVYNCATSGVLGGGFWYHSCHPGLPNSVWTSDKHRCSNSVCGYWYPYYISSTLLQFSC